MRIVTALLEFVIAAFLALISLHSEFLVIKVAAAISAGIAVTFGLDILLDFLPMRWKQ